MAGRLTRHPWCASAPPVAKDRSAPVLQSLIRTESFGGILLIGAAIAALVLANSDASAAYFAALNAYLGPLSVLHWVNDALMALFFLLVGLEVKREFTEGQLATWAERRLPIIAATAGMIVPALVYVILTRSEPALFSGWAIPTATDIAFALAVLALTGRGVPASLKVLLTTIAVVDDVLAIAVIAIFYTAQLEYLALLTAGLIFLLMLALNRGRVTALWPYALLALLLWAAVHASGIHATIAGVLAAMAIPVHRDVGSPGPSPLDRLEHGLQPWVAYAVLPTFAFANAGVRVDGFSAELLSPLAIAIAAALFVGKQVGIFASIRVAVALKFATRPDNASWLQIYAVALLCGIGFTVSLFIGALAFSDPLLLAEVKIGVLAGSIVSALTGFVILRVATQR